MKTFGKIAGAIAISLAAVSVASGNAEALTYSFYNISANNVADATAGETQLTVDVTALDGTDNLTSTQVLFTFNNVGNDAMSITDVYFDDGTLLGIAELYDADDGATNFGGTGDSGVDFSAGASPGNLPSANSANPDFQVTAGFLADSDPPAQPNGVNPGESLGILFNLQAGQTLASVYEALSINCLSNSDCADLRIGIHVQGFEGGGSESFINNPQNPPNQNIPPVPLPGALPLLLSALGFVGFSSWRKRRKQVAA